MTSLLQYEPFVDTTSKVFVRRLNELFAEPGNVCDLGTWLQYYAFDVMYSHFPPLSHKVIS